MSGFVGARARKKQRNISIIIILLILLGLFFFIFRKVEINNTKIVPNDNIVPDPTEDMTSLVSNIEQLELSLFQKDQKIKFRDGQINNLKTELQNTKSQYDALILELNDIKNNFKSLSSDNENLVSSEKFKSLQNRYKELNVENDDNITKIKKLNTKLLSVDKNINDIKLENQKLKKNNKNLFAKNLKLENKISDLNEKIILLQFDIDMYLDQIKDLKDTSHHGN